LRAALRLAAGIDAMSFAIGRTIKWLAVLLVVAQFAVVVLRYGFGSSFIWAQESVTYTHAVLFMLAISYCYMLDAHVRVDFFYARWSQRAKAWLELSGIVLMVWPFCMLLAWASWSYVAMSFRFNEGPMQHGGLPLQPYLKGLILVMAGLLAIQALSIAIRAVAVLRRRGGQVFPHRQTVGEA
jgi:TRAP-type mannitol/chloroaromatic compound transport system permease small subunit